MRVNPVAWFRQIWPHVDGRRAVISDYVAIGSGHKHFLADVALRGGVYRAFDPASDGTLENFNGRRELALELIKLCRVHPQELWGFVAEKPTGDRQ